MDSKAQLILALAALLIVAAVLVLVLSDDDVAQIIAIIGALASLIAGWFGVQRAMSTAGGGGFHTIDE